MTKQPTRGRCGRRTASGSPSTLTAKVGETRRIPATGGPSEKILDGFFRGDWIRRPDGNGTWIVRPGPQLIDAERRRLVWEQNFSGAGFTLPMFSRDGRWISASFAESRSDDIVRIFDSMTGTSRVVARLPFHLVFPRQLGRRRSSARRQSTGANLARSNARSSRSDYCFAVTTIRTAYPIRRFHRDRPYRLRRT
jgi:hypothetical protein